MAALRVSSFCMFLGYIRGRYFLEWGIDLLGTCNDIIGQIKFLNLLHIELELTWKWWPKSECQSIS